MEALASGPDVGEAEAREASAVTDARASSVPSPRDEPRPEAASQPEPPPASAPAVAEPAPSTEQVVGREMRAEEPAATASRDAPSPSREWGGTLVVAAALGCVLLGFAMRAGGLR